MKSKGYAVNVGESQRNDKAFSVRSNRFACPKHIEDIGKKLLERVDSLVDTCFFTVPFDEDLWDYLHELQKEILKIDKRTGPQKANMEWKYPAQEKMYCESIHKRLTECENALGLKTPKYQVYEAKPLTGENLYL